MNDFKNKMNKDLFIFLFIVVVAGLAISIPYVIDFFLKFFGRRKSRSTSSQVLNSRMDFYSAEFESNEVFDTIKNEPESEDNGIPYSGNIYICPECGSMKLRVSEPGKIICGDCQRVFIYKNNFNNNFH